MVENEALNPEPATPDAETAEPQDGAAAPEETKTGASAIGPRLVLKQNGAETETVFPLHAPATIGRFDPAVGPVDVDLGPLAEGVYVSRKHASVTCDDGVWRIRDLGSSNGTFVLRGSDFERVDEAELTDGTEIAFGNARFVFRIA
ncbi:MAG: FHA domain-containing protein [Fimbriimonadaceae bacterium]